MQNHGLVGEISKGLREAESQRPKAGPEAPDENERLHGEALAPLPPQIPDRHTFINQMRKYCFILRTRNMMTGNLQDAKGGQRAGQGQLNPAGVMGCTPWRAKQVDRSPR
jgi:hypothetical protein